MKTNSFSFRKYRLAANGEPFRRLSIFVVQVDGEVTFIDTYEPSSDLSYDEDQLYDLIGVLDVFRDGSCILSIHVETRAGALDDLLAQYPSLTPLDPQKARRDFYFESRLDRTAFQMICGG